MKKLLLILLLLPYLSSGQYCNSYSITDSFTYRFASEDTTYHTFSRKSFKLIPDTSSVKLWRVGATLKPTFSNGTTVVRGLMTDTMSSYPSNSNNYFTLDLGTISNPTIVFWHRYETDSLHDGGTVEFSTDTGATWMNVINCWSINTSVFYSSSDTLLSGKAAFMGRKTTTQMSCIDFFNCAAIKMTTTRCVSPEHYPTKLLLRFLFMSDSTVDSLSGWMIDSIMVNQTLCPTGVIDEPSMRDSIFIGPNPVFEELNIKASTTIQAVAVYNTVGQTILYKEPGTKETQIDVSRLPKGLYLLRVNQTETRRFIKE